MILCLDAGNTRLKWGVRDAGVWRAQGACVHADCVGLVAALPADVERIIACNVAGVDVAQRIEALAATLGVSRNVLRDSLASLAEMGLVTRRRGRGTIANTDLANAKCRIDIDPEIFIAFRDSGYSPTIHSCNLAFVPEKDPVFNSKHAGYLLSEKIITANNMPAAWR